MFINTQTQQVIPYEVLLAMYPNTSFPTEDDFTPPEPFARIYPSNKPEFDKRIQQVHEGAPVFIDGTYVQGWDIIEIFSTQAEKDASIAADNAAKEANRVAALWKAAHDYEYAQISGSAIGLLAIGVMQKLPKCLAVQNWIKSIWTIYYERKANGSTDTGFSSVGPCPYSIPELMIELGV